MCLLQLGVLWLFVAVRLTTAELVKVCTSDSVRVSCLESVTLHCNIISQKGLEIKHLSWFHTLKGTLCEVNGQMGETKTEPPNPQNPHRRVECTYTQSSQLTLTLLHVQPFDLGNYTCKLRSNKGIKHSTTDVKFQVNWNFVLVTCFSNNSQRLTVKMLTGSECYKDASASFNDVGPTCIFTGVYPDGEVHWFQGTNNLTGDAQNNTKQREVGGAWTVTSSLKIGNVEEAYNCSLWIPSTGVYLARRVVEWVGENSGHSDTLAGCGVVAFGPVWKHWGVLLFFHSIVSSV